MQAVRNPPRKMARPPPTNPRAAIISVPTRKRRQGDADADDDDGDGCAADRFGGRHRSARVVVGQTLGCHTLGCHT